MINGRVLAFVAAALVAACNGDSRQSPVVSQLLPKAKPKTAPAPVKHGPTVEELTAGMVEAVSLAKSNVPLGMKFQLSEGPTVGKPVDVVVALIPQDAADSASLKVTGSGGLQFAAGAAPHEIPAIEPGHVYKETVAVTPVSEGMQLLTLTVALTHDESSDSRTFLVPLIVSSAPTAASAQNPPVKRAAP